jgi:cobyric acid synthase CobQ
MRALTPAVMIQGTGSNVGKSVLVAGLARALVRRGLRVMPFKPQNMSNNAAIAIDGGEIGRAQAVQARAARIAPSVHMNPVLLKPETDTGSQVIVQGRRAGTMKARAFGEKKRDLMPAVLESFGLLAAQADIVLVEGAGSPAEINLRAGDIANMGFAIAADVPVILAGDIDRGGVIASLVGTHAVLTTEERSLVRGFLINKFRGDPRLFDAGVAAIREMTAWPCLGVVPWLPQTAWLPAEDALDLDRSGVAQAGIKIAVPVLSRIANFDDLDPLGMEDGVRLVFVRPGEAIPGDTDVVVLPGSKSTIGDLAFLRQQGWHIDIAAHVRRGGRVVGLCGGYQMLGKTIAGHRRRPRATRHRHHDDRRQIDPRGHGSAQRQRRARARLRDPSRPDRRARLRPTGGDDRRLPGRRHVRRRPRPGHVCAWSVRVRRIPLRLARRVRSRVSACLRGSCRTGARRPRRSSGDACRNGRSVCHRPAAMKRGQRCGAANSGRKQAACKRLLCCPNVRIDIVDTDEHIATHGESSHIFPRQCSPDGRGAVFGCRYEGEHQSSD